MPEVPRRRRPEPERAVERRAVPQLPQLLQHLQARDRVSGLRHQLRPGRREHPAEHAAAPELRQRVPGRPAGARDHVRPGAAGRRRLPDGSDRGARRPALHRHAAAQQVSGDLPCPARRVRAERPDARAREHVHLRRHRRHAGDDVGRQPAGAAHLDARARPLPRAAGGRVPVLVARRDQAVLHGRRAGLVPSHDPDERPGHDQHAVQVVALDGRGEPVGRHDRPARGRQHLPVRRPAAERALDDAVDRLPVRSDRPGAHDLPDHRPAERERDVPPAHAGRAGRPGGRALGRDPAPEVPRAERDVGGQRRRGAHNGQQPQLRPRGPRPRRGRHRPGDGEGSDAVRP